MTTPEKAEDSTQRTASQLLGSEVMGSEPTDSEQIDAEPVGGAPAAHDAAREQHLVSTRSELLPEEQTAGGSADPQAQAEVILADSEERTEVPNAAPTTHLERRGSTDGA